MKIFKHCILSLSKTTSVVLFCCLIALAQTTRATLSQSSGKIHAQSTASLIGELQRLLSAEVGAHPSLPGELLHVQAAKQGVDVSLASGLFDRESKVPLDPHHVFRVASVTKTFVAASILRLYEESRINLDDPINRYLPGEYNAILDGGGYPTKVITVRQLLTHTSGIFDYAKAPEYYAAVSGNPKHRWTRMEQLLDAVKWGKPYSAPGKSYHYSDTGYVLLGEIIERLSGKPMGTAFRMLLNFKGLKLDETYLETLEPVPAEIRPLSHPYLGEIDTVYFDPSLDLYGGGGLVSSVEDLARFYRALLRGQVFRHASTLQIMLTVPPTNEDSPGGPYAMGIARRNIAGNICWGHTGFWGTSAYHCPEADVTIVRHYNQAEPAPDFIFNTLYGQIARTLQISK